MLILLLTVFAGLAFGWHVAFWIVTSCLVLLFLDAFFN